MVKKIFRGRPILPGNIEGLATVSREGFNKTAAYKETLAQDGKTNNGYSFNDDSCGSDLNEAIVCLPQTITSTPGGFVLMGMADSELGPTAILFSSHLDSQAIGGLLLADIWTDQRIITIDLLGEEFLDAVHSGDLVRVRENGTVEIA